jgi:hypothetical protein
VSKRLDKKKSAKVVITIVIPSDFRKLLNSSRKIAKDLSGWFIASGATNKFLGETGKSRKKVAKQKDKSN